MFRRTIHVRLVPIVLLSVLIGGCTTAEPAVEEEVVEESLSRTEFTDEIENFFEYDALKAGEPSQFLIHLSKLDDGSPVADARVDMSVRSPATGTEVVATTAQVALVTGIYVAELNVATSGSYEIRFRVQNEDIDELMVLDGFAVR